MHRWMRWQQVWSEALGSGWRWLRTAPNLEAWGIMLAVGIVFVCQALGFHENQMPWMPSSGNEVPRDWQQPDKLTLFYNYIAPYLRLMGLLGGVLFHIAMVRAQANQRRLLWTIWLCSAFLALWFVLDDLYDQWVLLHGVLIGKPFSPVAYTGKLILLVIAGFTPAAAFTWYQRCPLWERYLVRSIVEPLAFCFIAFCSLWVLADLLDNMRDFQDNNVPTLKIFSFYLSLIPFVIVESAAPALLLATLHAILRLVRSNEMVSLQCAGLSTTSLMRPFWLVAAVVSLVSMAINYDWAQRAEAERTALLHGMQTTKKNTSSAFAIMHYHAETRRLWYVSLVPRDLRYDKLRGVEVRQFSEDGELLEGWSAGSVYRWANGMWSFSHGVHSRYIDGLSVPVDLFNTTSCARKQYDVLDWPETLWDLVNSSQLPSTMGVPDLAASLATQQKNQDHGVRLNFLSELWSRVSMPWHAFALAFVVSLLPPVHSRHGLMRCVGIAILLYLGLMFMNSATLNVARSGRVPAWIAVWMPHVLMLGTGLVLLQHRSGRHWNLPTWQDIPWRQIWRTVRGRRTWKSEVLGQFYRLNQGRETPRIRG